MKVWPKNVVARFIGLFVVAGFPSEPMVLTEPEVSLREGLSLAKGGQAKICANLCRHPCESVFSQRLKNGGKNEKP